MYLKGLFVSTGLVLLTACGGGGGASSSDVTDSTDNSNLADTGSSDGTEQTTSNSTIDFWQYLVPSDNVTVNYDKLPSNSAFQVSGVGTVANDYTFRTTYTSSDSVSVDYMYEGFVSDTANLSVTSNEIITSGSRTDRFIEIGQKIPERILYTVSRSWMSECSVKTLHDNYNPFTTYSYNNVLELECFESNVFLANGLGLVAEEVTDYDGNEPNYYLYLANNI